MVKINDKYMVDEDKHEDFDIDVNIGRDVKSKINSVMATSVPSTIADICGINEGDALYWDWYEDDNGNKLPRVVDIENGDSN